MHKQRTTHRHPIRGLFLTFSATLLTCTTSFAQPYSDSSSADLSAALPRGNSENPFTDSADENFQTEAVATQKTSQVSSAEFAARAPQIKSVYPLPWEAHIPQGFEWSDFTLKAINQYGGNLSSGAKDVTSFCPNYNKLAQDQKINFWGQLIGAMALYESGFKPTSHFREGTMGVDPITRQHVYSDGLLQLSYQDVTQYHFCDEFNWTHDSQLGALDPRKTIFDPYINLRCGIRILNAQVARTGMISYRKGQYWSVLWPAHVEKVKAVTRKTPYCASK